ncbi:MAG: SAM-dependent methyltransferase [Thermotoga sp.]|nr:MAG: SAM-dependent methyltransferase [Thermotoga sp.]HDM69920.1 tRNA (adenine-N1)-methyltransferase [Thermotogales bacterium]
MEIGNGIVKDGDDVLILLEDGTTYLLKVRRGKTFGTHLGNLRYDEMIGKNFGDFLRIEKGKAYILKPGMDDYIRKMKRATQIVYPKDIGYILIMLDVKNGDRIIDAGLGSGAMCGALARYVGENGRIYAYERREKFVEIARENLRRWGVLERVEIKLKDVEEGFDEKDVDAIFLDLPEPWCCLDKAWNSLKFSGRIGIICPTTNQVQKVLLEMENLGFVRTKVWEIMHREYKPNPERLRPVDRMVAHTAYLIFGIKVKTGKECES